MPPTQGSATCFLCKTRDLTSIQHADAIAMKQNSKAELKVLATEQKTSKFVSSDSSDGSFEDPMECAVATEYKSFIALDGGWAWVVVFVAFVVHILTRGVLFSTGVLFSEWISFFGKSKGETAWIGSIATGSALLLGPLTSRFIEIWGYRVVGIAGGCICTIGFLASYLATGIHFLYFSYGVVAGSGLGISYLCSVVAVGEYFDKRRSLAFGIAASGAGCGTAVMAILQQSLLNEYGWRGTMIILAGVSGMHQIACGALLRPLSSSLNRWSSKRKLHHIKLADAGTPLRDENEEADSVCEIRSSLNSLWNKESKPHSGSSADSGFSGTGHSVVSHGKMEGSSTGVDTRTNNSDEIALKITCNDSQTQYFESPSPSRERSFSGSHIPTAKITPPALMLRRKIAKRSANTVNRSSIGAMRQGTMSMCNLLNNELNHRASCNSLKESQAAFGTKQYTSPYRRRSNIHLRVGDALYLSSLSISSSKAVANSILFDDMERHAVTSGEMIDVTAETLDTNQKSVQISEHPTAILLDAADLVNPCQTSVADMHEDNTEACVLDKTMRNRKFPPLLRNPLFIMIVLNQFFTGLGVMVPFVHLTEKAILMGISEAKAALLISIIGIGNVVGKILLGLLCDMKSSDVFIVFLTSQFGIALPVLMIPIFSSYSSLIIFCFTFGFFYGNYSAIPSLVAEYVGLHNLAQGMGYINFLEGAAGIIGPPLAGLIYDATQNYNIAFVSAGCFLLLSCLILFLQPVYHVRITGQKSSISTFCMQLKRKMRRVKRPESIAPKKHMMQDINANFVTKKAYHMGNMNQL